MSNLLVVVARLLSSSSREERTENAKRLTSAEKKGGRRCSTRIREFPSLQSDARSPAPSLALPENECLLCVPVPGLKELLV